MANDAKRFKKTYSQEEEVKSLLCMTGLSLRKKESQDSPKNGLSWLF